MTARAFPHSQSLPQSEATVRRPPDCLGCALLEMPERCVTWEGGEVRCDECGGRQ